jgi:hypothetical protein
MILESLDIDSAELERRTGWEIKPEGACKGDVCVPLPRPSAALDARVLSEALRMPLVRDEGSGLWCLGPESGGKALDSARAPELVLPDHRGAEFRLSSLRGSKVLLVAWASW